MAIRSLRHILFLLVGQLDKFFEQPIQRSLFTGRGENSGTAVHNCLPAAGDVAGDERPPRRARLEQGVGHPLVVGGEHKAVAALVERADVGLKAVVANDPFADEPVNFFFVVILKGANDVK